MKPVTYKSPLWERSILRETAGATLRPGGFALTDRGISLARIPALGRVLDVGCGLGATIDHIITKYKFKACGVDNSIRQLTESTNHLPLTLAEADKLPYPDACFDALLCECVLSLVPDLEQTISEFKRTVKPTGKFIITDIYQRTPHGHEIGNDSCASSPLDLSKLEKCLRQNNMKISTLEDHSKMLAELAAKLIFAGEKDVRLTGNCCSRPGYMLLIAEPSL